MNAPIIKYKTGHFADGIEPTECLKETAKMLVVLNRDFNGTTYERKELKSSEYTQYHDTWADAHAYLIAKAERNVASARRNLELANAKLGNIKGMKPPKESA